MSVRLQVVMNEEEISIYRKIARRSGLTLSEWVRQALRHAAREEPDRDVARKLASIRAAATHGFPAPDVEQMNEEINRGYGGEGS